MERQNHDRPNRDGLAEVKLDPPEKVLYTERILGAEQAAKSGGLAKLAIGDDVRLVRKTAVVIRTE